MSCLALAHVPKKEECRTRHCSRDADQGARRNSTRPALLSECGQGCFLRIQGRCRPGWSFPLKQFLTRTESSDCRRKLLCRLRIRFVRSPGQGFMAASTVASRKGKSTPTTGEKLRAGGKNRASRRAAICVLLAGSRRGGVNLAVQTRRRAIAPGCYAGMGPGM